MGRNNFFKKNQKNLFLSEKNDWKKIEKNNVTIVLNIFACEKKKKNYPAYVSKNNLNREKQVILLMIPNEKKS